MANVGYLPADVVTEILARLPVKSLLQFKLVSKSWYTLITSPYFISKHLHHSNKNNLLVRSRFKASNNVSISLIADESSQGLVNLCVPLLQELDFSFVGSCNGLICIRLSGCETCIILWNPATKEIRILSVPFSVFPSVTLGFGFDLVSKDYKLVKIVAAQPPLAAHKVVQVWVWRMSTNCWRELVDFAFPNFVDKAIGAVTGSTIWNSLSMPVLITGVLYWVTFAADFPSTDSIVVAFDLANEKFKQVPVPEDLDQLNGVSMLHLIELKGCLALSASFSTAGINCFYIWVKDKCENSWTKHLSIGPNPSLVHPVGCCRNCLVVVEDDEGFKLCLYEPSVDGRRRELPTPDASCQFEVCNYVESLVPIKIKKP